MDTYFNALSWWRMPLEAIGGELIAFLAVMLAFAIVLGLVSYIMRIL